MNDGSETLVEVDLRRRLEAFAGIATVDDQGWENLQARIAGSDAARRRLPSRPLAAAAAVIIVLVAIALVRHDGDGRVETVDDTTTTRDETSTTTSTPSTTTADPNATGTTLAGAGDASGGPGSAGGADGATGDGAAASGADVTVPEPAGPSGSPSGASDGAGPAPPATTSPPATAGGLTVWVNYTTPEYTLQGTFEEIRPGTFYMNIWRPDWGHVSDWLASDRPGQNCLAGKNGASVAFPEPGEHLYSWGLVRSDAAQVRVVTHTGEWTTAVIGGEAAPGIRPWIARRDTTQISHFEALDARGNVLHTASWDAYPDTC